MAKIEKIKEFINFAVQKKTLKHQIMIHSLRIYLLSLLCLFAFCFTTTAVLAQDDDFQHKKDSLLRVIDAAQGKEKLDAYYELANLNFPEEELDIMLQYINDFIKEAQHQKDKDKEGFARRRESAVLYNFRKIDDFQKKTKEHLVFFKTNNEQEDYYYLYQFLIVTYGTQGDKNKVLTEAKKMYEEAKSENCLFGIAQATSLLSRAYAIEKRYGEAETFAKETIEIAKKMLKNDNDKPDNHFLLLGTYADLTDILIDLNKFDEIALIMLDWREQLTHYEHTFEDINREGLRLYYNFKTRIYAVTKEYDKAKIYCDSLEQMNLDLYSETCLWEYKSIIYENTNEYDKALYCIDKVIERFFFGNPEAVADFTKNKARILCKMGRGEEAWPLYEQAFLQNDSLHLIEYNEQLDELRTEYEVDKHIAEKIRNRNYFLFALGGCVLLLIALGIWIYMNLKIRIKNRTLARQIKALTTKQEEQVNEMIEKTSFVPKEETPETVDEDENSIDTRLNKLCIAIRDLILKDKIYRNPALTQELVIETLGTSRRVFSEVFEFCFKMQFKDYINFLRMKDAILLLDKSDLTIEEIADAAGFGTVRTFQRQFSAKYNMSPKEYRGVVK